MVLSRYAYLHCIVDLVSLCLLDSWVVCALANQQRHLDLVCMVVRADPLIQLLVILNITHSVYKLLLHGSPVRWDGLEKCAHMRWSHNIHTTAFTSALLSFLECTSAGNCQCCISHFPRSAMQCIGMQVSASCTSFATNHMTFACMFQNLCQLGCMVCQHQVLH